MSTDSQDEIFLGQREHMVRYQIERRGVETPNVLEAMRAVPRHLFVPPDQQEFAYSDGAMRIGHGQTISQPYIVALMTDLLKLSGGEKVLEVGTGSGYQAAVLAQIAKEVHSIERHAPLSDNAYQVFDELNIGNIHLHVGDGTLGLSDQAPFQGIMVTAAAPKVPKALLNQLDQGGRLVLPVGRRFSQVLEVWQRVGAKYEQETLTAVAFVPLIGEEGWPEGKGDRSFF
ncbi:MAG: protein-L-isoaspartate(D-aspartate) O-methyltransferase [Anaerolineales bacterium]|nr:protein-L-isoaspartate(D-aspartate) O-methyltransferase [Chloroflexota bacterium]MBL6980921.1 protein-L-isoaspartate(D-aspartate) O-methyltransferase [Anaerolineales bacterium]